jgi:Tfp pilus assembly pilus retraction ATPase PilT
MDTIGEYDMTDLLTLIVSERAEGLSIAPGRAPAVHLRGEMHLIEGPAISPEHAESLLRSLADTRQMRELHERGTAEFLFTFRESARFRVEARSEHEQIQFHIHAIAA